MKNTGNKMIDHLEDHFNILESRLNGKKSWNKLRKVAFDTLVKNGLPLAKDEDYRYTNVRRAFEKTVNFSGLSNISVSRDHGEIPLFQEVDAIHIFINNGIVNKSKLMNLAHPDLDILTLQEASEKFSSEVEAHFGRHADINKDGFTALNTAFSDEGIFIKIHKNAKIDIPIILHYSAENASDITLFQSRILIIAEQGAQANIVESYSSTSTEDQFSNHVSELVVGANANINYYKLQNQNNKSYHIDNTCITQARDSVVQTYTFTLQGKLIRNNLNYFLEGENCEAHMFGLYLGHEDGHIDNHTVMDHKVANCYSNEIYKGILDDNSKGVFNGKIFVRKDAQKTNAFQTNKNILLTDTASIYTKPQLEIWADDVSCSHGCTTGQLDEEQLFYLRSRGINKSSARAMLLHAFVNDILDKININFLYDFVNDEIYNRLD